VVATDCVGRDSNNSNGTDDNHGNGGICSNESHTYISRNVHIIGHISVDEECVVYMERAVFWDGMLCDLLHPL
jgi:hypothetical protein